MWLLDGAGSNDDLAVEYEPVGRGHTPRYPAETITHHTTRSSRQSRQDRSFDTLLAAI
jgi:hypothetical protein